MPHFDIPSGSHSMMHGSLFVWNTTDGPGAVTKYKFQVGTQPGYYNIYNGSWITQGGPFPPGQWTDNVTGLPGNGSTLYVRAQYVKNGQLGYTNPVSFVCNA
jgi:hypothetical protein